LIITLEEVHQGLLEPEAATEAKKTRRLKKKGKETFHEEEGASDPDSGNEDA
jgi:hypothetical protein